MKLLAVLIVSGVVDADTFFSSASREPSRGIQLRQLLCHLKGCESTESNPGPKK
jgi:hypothetical protein